MKAKRPKSSKRKNSKDDMLTENDNSNLVEMKGKFKLLGFANVTTSYRYY